MLWVGSSVSLYRGVLQKKTMCLSSFWRVVACAAVVAAVEGAVAVDGAGAGVVAVVVAGAVAVVVVVAVAVAAAASGYDRFPIIGRFTG